MCAGDLSAPTNAAVGESKAENPAERSQGLGGARRESPLTPTTAAGGTRRSWRSADTGVELQAQAARANPPEDPPSDLLQASDSSGWRQESKKHVPSNYTAPTFWGEADVTAEGGVDGRPQGDGQQTGPTSQPIWVRWRDEQLQAVFDDLKDDEGKVGLIQLRAALFEVNVGMRSELLWDLLHLADENGQVRLDYDAFSRLLIGVLESSNTFRWGSDGSGANTGGAPGLGDASAMAGATATEAMGLYERLSPSWRGDGGGRAGKARGLGDARSGFWRDEETEENKGINTEEYMKLLNSGPAYNHSSAVATNWALLIKHHAAEWKGVWTTYAVAPAPPGDSAGRVSTQEPVVLEWPSERRRVVSLIEPRPLAESISYVDIDLGSWSQDLSHINTPAEIDRTDALAPHLHGFFDKLRSCRPPSLQRVHIGTSYMCTSRRGALWSCEAASVVGDSWRVRLVAVYEDQRQADGLRTHAELRHVISITEHRDEFPADDLASLPFPFSSAPLSYEGLVACGQWLGLSESVQGKSQDTCPATGADSHMMVEWDGFRRVPAEDTEGGRGGRIAGMQDNSVFLLPGGRLLVAPRSISLASPSDLHPAGRRDVALSFSFMVGTGMSVAHAQMNRVTRVLDRTAVAAGPGSARAGGQLVSSAEAAKKGQRLDPSNRFTKQTLEQFWLHEPA